MSLTQWTWIWANPGTVKDRDVWYASVGGVAKSQTWLINCNNNNTFFCTACCCSLTISLTSTIIYYKLSGRKNHASYFSVPPPSTGHMLVATESCSTGTLRWADRQAPQISLAGPAWHAAVHGITKSWTWLSNWTTTISLIQYMTACQCHKETLQLGSPSSF